MTEKYCSKCQQTKPITEFSKNKTRKDGLHHQCKSCAKIANKLWRENNPESNNLWRENNREKDRLNKRNWYNDNIEKGRQCNANYRIKNPTIFRNLAAKRRALYLQAVPSWFETDKVTLIYKKALEWGMEVDHVVPLQGKTVCGLHCWANLQLLESSLNSSKGNREWPDQ